MYVLQTRRKGIRFVFLPHTPPLSFSSFFFFSFAQIITTMRLTTQAEQDAASRYALKGFAVGMLWLGGVGFAASAVGQFALPWYRRVPIQNKVSSPSF